MTSEIVAADTLKIRSLRTIDICSAEQRALISIDLGEIYFADSLLSFDITLSYDTTYLRPGSILASGTLSDQMRWLDGPFLNAAIPGELRLLGASLSTPVKGAFPLVAVTADAKQAQCGVRTPISLTIPPEFNEEFRRRYEIATTDSVQFVANAVSRPDLGISSNIEDVVIQGKDSVMSIPLQFASLGIESQDMTMTIAVSNVEVFIIDSVNVQEADVWVSEMRDTVVIVPTTSGPLQTGTIWLKQVTNDSATAVLRMATTTVACRCLKPTRTDSVNVVTKAPKTTVSVVDEDSEITKRGNAIHIQGYHEHPILVEIIDVLGRMLLQQQLQPGESVVNIDQLPPGPFFVIARDGGRQKRMFEWK